MSDIIPTVKVKSEAHSEGFFVTNAEDFIHGVHELFEEAEAEALNILERTWNAARDAAESFARKGEQMLGLGETGAVAGDGSGQSLPLVTDTEKMAGPIDNYAELTKDDLKSLMDARSVGYKSADTKDDLIAALRAADAPQ